MSFGGWKLVVEVGCIQRKCLAVCAMCSQCSALSIAVCLQVCLPIPFVLLILLSLPSHRYAPRLLLSKQAATLQRRGVRPFHHADFCQAWKPPLCCQAKCCHAPDWLHVGCRVFHRGVLQLVDKTLGLRISMPLIVLHCARLWWI